MVNIRRGIVARGAHRHDGWRSCALSTAERAHRNRRLGHAHRARRPSAGGQALSRSRQARALSPGNATQHGNRRRNLCLDTRCIFYNQSEWWRAANHHCLKTTGDICHVARKATMSAMRPSAAISPRPCSRSVPRSTSPPGGHAHAAAQTVSISATRARMSRQRNPWRRQVFSRAAAGRIHHGGGARRIRPACARPTTRFASAARSSIRSPAWRWRCAGRAINSPTCVSPSPAPIRAGAARRHGAALRRSARRSRPQGPRRSRARPDHGDEDHLHARPLRRRVAGVLAKEAGDEIIR